MYGGFEVFKLYLAIKLHFTTDTYNYEEYGGKVNCKLETFTKRNDRYFFHKLSKRYIQMRKNWRELENANNNIQESTTLYNT